ncbi:MAG: hypothetical protein CME62_00355 [Halobacteriovoraceae bacterium]|nr:hypothetical protein [Halobacteriovoraceae bacterium]|tara:strand:- start:33 stop:233 length:201 start_codon:yes stop_codon:yes gene_type:complete
MKKRKPRHEHDSKINIESRESLKSRLTQTDQLSGGPLRPRNIKHKSGIAENLKIVVENGIVFLKRK